MLDLETYYLDLQTGGNCQISDITDNVGIIVRNSGFIEGTVNIFSVGSTTGITTLEYEPGLLKDYPALLDRLIPTDKKYYHDQTWNDGNGHSHLRSALQGTSFSVPFKEQRLILGTWQQIVFVDFDNRDRNRKIVVQIIGKKHKGQE